MPSVIPVNRLPGPPREIATKLFSVLPRALEPAGQAAGASTISQQLAKNLYLSSSRNPLRKVKEAVTTYRLETALGKRRIMELYLNVAELGDGIWGAEAASRKYFQARRRATPREQAATLARIAALPAQAPTPASSQAECDGGGISSCAGCTESG